MLGVIVGEARWGEAKRGRERRRGGKWQKRGVAAVRCGAVWCGAVWCAGRRQIPLPANAADRYKVFKVVKDFNAASGGNPRRSKKQKTLLPTLKAANFRRRDPNDFNDPNKTARETFLPDLIGGDSRRRVPKPLTRNKPPC